MQLRNVRFVVDTFVEMFEMEIYPSQTKNLEGRAGLSECVFEALFKGVSTRFGLRIVEKCFENALGYIRSTFQNLRLGSIRLSKRRGLVALPTAGLPCGKQHLRDLPTPDWARQAH